MLKLAQETIDIIRQAEQQGDQMEKDAAIESDRLLQIAQEQAQKLFEDSTSESKIKAQAVLEVAKQQGDQIISEQLQLAEEEIAALSRTAATKEQEAIKLIISELY